MSSMPLLLSSYEGSASLLGSLQQNQNLADAGASAADATELQYQQLDEQAALEVRKRAIETQQVRSRLRVLAADSGFDFGGSYLALERQALIDQQVNDAITAQNAWYAKRHAASELSARLINLSSQSTNPILAGLKGGLGGYRTGLEIGAAMPSGTVPAQTVGGGGGLDASQLYGDSGNLTWDWQP